MTWADKGSIQGAPGGQTGTLTTGAAVVTFPSTSLSGTATSTWGRFPAYESVYTSPGSGLTGSTSKQAVFVTQGQPGGMFLLRAGIRLQSISPSTIPNGSQFLLTWCIDGTYSEEYKTVKYFEGGRHVAHSISSVMRLDSGSWVYPALFLFDSTTIMRAQTFFTVARLSRD